MDVLNLGLMIFHMFLELYIFDYKNSPLLSFNFLMALCLPACAFYVKSEFKRFSWIFAYTIVFLDFTIGMYLVQAYHDNSFQPLLQTHNMLISLLSLIAFSFAKEQDFRQIKQSKRIGPFLTLFYNIIFIEATFGYFKYNHLKAATNETIIGINNYNLITEPHNAKFYYKLFEDLIVDFFIIYNMALTINLTKYYYSKKRDFKYIKIIIKRFITLAFISLIYYLNYNNQFNQFVSELNNKFVPQPHNIILYNSMPESRDVRFKLIIFGIFYLI